MQGRGNNMKNSTSINIAVVGLGWVATQRHIPIILQNPRLHFYGVVDKSPERIKRLSEQNPWIKTSLSQEGDMPWAEQVQAVLIATDPINHYKLAKKMLLMGKHVLMEKPLTMTPAESAELLEIATQQKVSFCVVHNFQYARSTLKLQQLIKSGKLGEVLSIEALQFSNPRRRLPIWYEQLPFGLFYDESPHMLYMLETLAGNQLRRITSQVLQRSGQKTPLLVTGHYVAGEIPVKLSMNFEAALSEWHVTVMGTRQVGIVDLFRDILITLPNDQAHRAREILTSSGSAMLTHIIGFAQSGALLLRKKLFYGADLVWQNFIDEVEGIRRSPQISAVYGAKIVNMQHEIMNNSNIIEVTKV